jgi:uncharacterized OB-fold protein
VTVSDEAGPQAGPVTDKARPPGVPVRDGLFTGGAGEPPRLLGSRCVSCGRPHFPRQDRCPYCSATGAEPVELSPTGTLWAFTAVTAAPPGYRGAVPYGFGVVELPEGLRVISRLTESDPATLRSGDPVHLVLDVLHHDDDGRPVLTYAFAPTGPVTP